MAASFEPRTNELLAAICADLAKLFPSLRVCDPHDGRFDLAELRRIATRTPALYVSCLGTARVEDPGTEQTEAAKQLAVYVVTANAPAKEGRPKLSRGEAARNLVDALEVHIPRARWGLKGIGGAEQLRSDNLYSGAIDKTGIALWAVRWRQTLRLGESIFSGEKDCPVPEELYSIRDPEPADLDPAGDYEQVAG